MRRGPVWLQVAALLEEPAAKLADRLSREGYSVTTEKVPNKILVRVIIGPVEPGVQAKIAGWGFAPLLVMPRPPAVALQR